MAAMTARQAPRNAGAWLARNPRVIFADGVFSGEVGDPLHVRVGASGAIYAIRRGLRKSLPLNLILDDVYLSCPPTRGAVDFTRDA